MERRPLITTTQDSQNGTPTTHSISEALAALKLTQKKISSKEEFVQRYLTRREEMRDPLDRQGGSPQILKQERQAIADLYEQTIRIRRAIHAINSGTDLSVDGHTRTIADWLVWKREVYPVQQHNLRALANLIEHQRRQVQQGGRGQVVGAAVAVSGEAKPGDVVVNVSETELQAELEKIETIYGTLDGLLTLKNATLQVTY